MQFLLKQHFQIESARYLPNLPQNHPCSRTHGHSFKITFVFLTTMDSKTGWGLDYHDISRWVQPILNQLDHRLLNEVPGLENPTSEYITAWIYEKVKAHLPDLTQVGVSETSTTECWYPAK